MTFGKRVQIYAALAVALGLFSVLWVIADQAGGSPHSTTLVFVLIEFAMVAFFIAQMVSGAARACGRL